LRRAGLSLGFRKGLYCRKPAFARPGAGSSRSLRRRPAPRLRGILRWRPPLSPGGASGRLPAVATAVGFRGSLETRQGKPRNPRERALRRPGGRPEAPFGRACPGRPGMPREARQAPGSGGIRRQRRAFPAASAPALDAAVLSFRALYPGRHSVRPALPALPALPGGLSGRGSPGLAFPDCPSGSGFPDPAFRAWPSGRGSPGPALSTRRLSVCLLPSCTPRKAARYYDLKSCLLSQ
jgi:hypothetical protein